MMRASHSRRKTKVIDGRLYFYCTGELHQKGKWLPANKFYKQWNKEKHKYYYRSICKSCIVARHSRYKKSTPSGYTQHGFVPIADIRPWLDEIIIRCEGYRPAARAIGCHISSIYVWLGKTKGKHRYMQRNSAARILRTLQELRAGFKSESRLKPGPKRKGATLPGEKQA